MSHNLRALAAKIIHQVLQGKSLTDELKYALTQIPEQRDQALVQALCFGVCRRYFFLDAISRLLLEKPFKEKDGDIHALLLVGLYQLIEMRIPAYAAVGETVAAADDFKKSWAKNLINAVLRNYQRHADAVLDAASEDPDAIHDHPNWFIGKIKKAWPDHWEGILAANNAHPPMSLRVNQRIVTREAYLAQLEAENIQATAIPETQYGITLTEPVDVLALPGFLEGYVSVQDGAAQLAAPLLLLTKGLRVLDACAAPGGKTAHIAESEPELEKLIAVDHDAKRVMMIEENIKRLRLSAETVVADVAEIDKWWNGEPFDRILLDAPCSASGVIRRHPDIKLLRRPDDIAEMAYVQLSLLNALWPLLKVNGLLLYATCSVLPQENTKTLAAFLANHSDAKEEKIIADWGQACEIGRQIMPGMHGMDGFYYARLRKCD